ncbi:MAG: tRNA 2-selenouridine(34) synthase MnmH [Bacteroidia bacterium]|nr:tRNA 2-selenouridine(34) synthase MnmH [Bacteroidia bacterium]
MTLRVNTEEFLSFSYPIFDVRSPIEFDKGHIPGAINLPLFSNEERVLVGTAYVNQGKDEAIKIGLEKVQSKLVSFVETVNNIAKGDNIRLHCWRGGMRSKNMAWLLETAGYNVYILEGGYKNYRQFVRTYFEKQFKLIVIGGMTGSGKTEILHYLKENNEQVIDLEGLANHKGSVFGHFGQLQQPSTEHFENLLFTKLKNQKTEKPIWIEDESLTIGNIYIPRLFHEQMQSTEFILLERNINDRAERLVKEYAHFEKDLLISAVQRISRRIGGDKAQVIVNYLINNDFFNAILTILNYYDKQYLFSLKRHKNNNVKELNINNLSVQEICNKLVNYKKINNGRN